MGPRDVRVRGRSDGSGPPEQVQPMRRNPSAVGGSGGPEESACDVPVGPGSTHRHLEGGSVACFFSNSSNSNQNGKYLSYTEIN